MTEDTIVPPAAAVHDTVAPKPKKQVQLVGIPPQGPPVPKDDADSDVSDPEHPREHRPGGESDSDEEDEGVSSADGPSSSAQRSDANEASGSALVASGDADQDGDVNDEDLLASYTGEEEIIDLTHLRLNTRSLRKLGLPRFSKSTQRLCLRQNFITKISAADVGALEELRDLDLYDNGLEKTYGDALAACSKLETLDMSFNSIHHLSHLSHLANCHTLYFVQNKITRVRPTDLAAPLGDRLRSLELGGNRLRKIENIDHLHHLEELWLGKNKITKLESITTLTSLRILSIQSNRITKIENLEKLTALRELYLSHNGLTVLEGLENNLQLETLDVGANRIERIENVAHLTKLEEFWANNNAIPALTDVEAQLGPQRMPDLATVYLEGNPAQRAEGAAYRRKLKLLLPQIRQIDATYVR